MPSITSIKKRIPNLESEPASIAAEEEIEEAKYKFPKFEPSL